MNISRTLYSILSIILHVNSLIIPEEVPSILSLIYSNIPPIRKGTDSRVGFGFRLGEHADFQLLFELGPQRNTRPLGNENPSPSKRHVQRFNNNMLQLLQKPNKPTEEKITDSDGGKWLLAWQQTMKKKQEPLVQFVVTDGEDESYEGAGEIKASDVIPDDPVQESNESQIDYTSAEQQNSDEKVVQLKQTEAQNQTETQNQTNPTNKD